MTLEIKSDDNDPLVSIIIINYNGKSHLEKCLESLLKVNYTNFEIIIIDNNSTDGSVEFVKNNYSQIKIKKLEKNYGFAYPNNLGAKISNGDYLLFLNNDTIVTPNFIFELVEIISSNPNIVICQSLLLKMNGDVDSSGDFIDYLGREFNSREKKPTFQRILSARGASMLVKKDVFFELGGFDEKFFVSFEDVDLGWRANMCDYSVVLAPKSVVYHLGGGTTGKTELDIQFHGVKNSLILRLTNFEFSYAIRSITVLFFTSVMKKFFRISIINDPEVRPPLPSSKIIISGIFWILKNYKYIFKKRKQVNKMRIKSTKELIKMKLIRKNVIV